MLAFATTLTWDLADVQTDTDGAGIDEPLVRAARQRKDAYRRLVEKYQARVYATALRLTGDPSEARDIAQDAFLKAYEKLDRFDCSRSFGPWVCAIAANLARDHLRSPLKRWFKVGTHDQPEASTEGDPVVEEDERAGALQGALTRLPMKLRQAVVLRYVSGLTVEEVAVALGIGESAAKMRLKRGVEQLRAFVDAAG